jgi:hypothetical protein
MKELSDRISVIANYDRFTRRQIVLGDLTQKQYAALADCVRLSPNYGFEVVRYEEREGAHGSAATHVIIWKDGNKCDSVARRRAGLWPGLQNPDRNDRDSVALVGRDCAQYYDSSKETAQVVKRVSHRVYRKACVYFT